MPVLASALRARWVSRCPTVQSGRRVGWRAWASVRSRMAFSMRRWVAVAPAIQAAGTADIRAHIVAADGRQSLPTASRLAIMATEHEPSGLIGASVLRVEDPALVTGQGHYTD